MKARIPSWQDWPLAIRLTLLITILIAGIVIIITWVTLRREQAAFREELQQQTEILLGGIGGVTGDALYGGDVDTIDDLVQGLRRREVLVFGRIYNNEGRIVADAVEQSNAFLLTVDPYGLQLLESDSTVFDWQPDRLIAGQAVTAGPQVLGAVSVGLPTSNMDAKLVATRNQGIGLALGAIVIGVVFAFIFSRTITNPLQDLVQVSQQMAAGDMTVRVDQAGKDEIGTLATAYNDMAKQLQQNINALEQRTLALATIGEISRRLSTILEINPLVREVAHQVQAAFQYYHVQIYLFDEGQQNLVLASSTGQAGKTMLSDSHSLLLDEGLVGQAATAREPVLVPDVDADPNWLPNPLLPDTKAETAIPMLYGDNLLGILDVQQNITNGLSADDVQVLQSVAAQVAIALRNARLYEQVQKRAQHEAIVNQIGQQIQAAADIESVLQIAARELGTALQAECTQVQLGHVSNGHPEGRV